MKANRAKEYLMRIQFLDIKIRQREEEYVRLVTEISSPKSQDFTADRVQSSVHPDPMADTVIRCEDMLGEIKGLIRVMQKQRHKIIAEIHTLDNPQYVEILSMRYVSLIPLPLIARTLRKPSGAPYSYQRIASLHGEALRAFEHDVLDKNISDKKKMKEMRGNERMLYDMLMLMKCSSVHF